MSTANIHYNDIRPDLFDILIGNTKVRLVTKKIAEFVTARHDHLTYLSATFIKFQIADSPQLFTIPQIDHIFAFQFRKTHLVIAQA